MRFEAQKSIEASKYGSVNATFSFVESAEHIYKIGIYFNRFHLLDLDNTGKVTLTKDAKSHNMPKDLFVTRLGNNNSKDEHQNRILFKLTMKPFRVPTFYRLYEFVEKVVYKVRILGLNETYEFSTDYLNDCDTIVGTCKKNFLDLFSDF